jgi:hypothetical protein
MSSEKLLLGTITTSLVLMGLTGLVKILVIAAGASFVYVLLKSWDC